MHPISSEQQQKLLELYSQVSQDTQGRMPDMQAIINNVLDETNIVFRAAVAHNTGGYSADYLALLSLLREIVLVQNLETA